MSGLEGQFQAAVAVMQNLPRNGSFQPSEELLLQFDSYYQQATLGVCNIPKPKLWYAMDRARWEAWNRLGQMSKSQAMALYVEELKKIIETMSLSYEVTQFLELLGPFYDFVKDEDLDSVNYLLGKLPDDSHTEISSLMAKAQQLQSTLDSMERNVIQEEPYETDLDDDSFDLSSEEDGDFVDALSDHGSIIDTDQVSFQVPTFANFLSPQKTALLYNFKVSECCCSELENPLSDAVMRVQSDIDQLIDRIEHMEHLLLRKSHRSVLFPDLSTKTTLFLLTWPFAAFAIATMLRRYVCWGQLIQSSSRL